MQLVLIDNNGDQCVVETGLELASYWDDSNDADLLENIRCAVSAMNADRIELETGA